MDGAIRSRERCKRGYEVAFTSGHTTPIADMMAVSPIKKAMFLVDVKGLYRKNPWLIKRKTARNNLLYILAFVPIGHTIGILFSANNPLLL